MHSEGHVEGYIPRITASKHLIGKHSLVISFAMSINLWKKQTLISNINKLSFIYYYAEQ